MTTKTTNIEPTWEQILNAAQQVRSPESIEVLRPVCVFADAIRQAQRDGEKRLVIDLSKKDITLSKVPKRWYK